MEYSILALTVAAVLIASVSYSYESDFLGIQKAFSELSDHEQRIQELEIAKALHENQFRIIDHKLDKNYNEIAQVRDYLINKP